MTAEDILRAAKEKFDAVPTVNIGCTSNCTGKCSAQGHKGTPSRRRLSTLIGDITYPTWAKYCASYDSNRNWSSSTAYSCPGHRDSKEITNRYPFPNDTDLSTTKIIYASQLTQLYDNIKQEINDRLNHIFYSELEF